LNKAPYHVILPSNIRFGDQVTSIENSSDQNQPSGVGWRQRLRDIVIRIKKLQGDPHYIAMGMAIGVFVAITPTIPFHTAIALGLAFILKGSKPAAVIGVWFSNPLTIPTLYYGCYKVGNALLGDGTPNEIAVHSFSELLELGWNVTVVMLFGGLVLGIPPAIVTYFITLRIFVKIRSRSRRRRKKRLADAAEKDLANYDAQRGNVKDDIP
jgi:uncharacterized protein (DUF2062 family)